MSAGEVIKRLRDIKKWSQNELAQKSGVPQSSISYVEKHERDLPIDYAVKLATALDCNVLDIIWEELGITPNDKPSTYQDPTIDSIASMLQDMPAEERRKVFEYAEEKKRLAELTELVSRLRKKQSNN